MPDIVYTSVKPYIFMSACLHVKINADVQKELLQTYADITIPHKIRLFYKMSACLQNIYYI